MGGIGNTTPQEAVPILPRQYGHFNLLGTLLKQIRSKLAINSLWTKTTLCTPRDWGGSAPVTLVTKLISIFSTQGTLNSFTFYKFPNEIICKLISNTPGGLSYVDMVLLSDYGIIYLVDLHIK